jgi:formylglycine-generating enzyme required for sulfatase activity
MPWSRLWPFLKTTLGASVETAQLDVPPIVQRLARGQRLQRLPRKRHQGWAATCQVLIDFADSLRPFWTDFHAVRQRLAPLRGMQGLKVLALPDGDPEGRCWAWSFRHKDWQELPAYPLPTPGTPVLVLSDVGCIDATGVRRQPWRRLGLRLRQVGCQPVALMPCPRRWWDGEVTQLFMPVCWDRGARPARRPRPYRGQAAGVQQDAPAAHLLEVLGAAIRVEPALLRAVRFLLPEVDVGSEVAAWNHPHVHATPRAFFYDHEEVARYRQAFAGPQDTALQRAVAELILTSHAHLSPAIVIEELCLLAASGHVLKPQEVEGFLARLVRRVREQHGPFVEAVRAWIQRAAQRQYAQVWQNDCLAALWVAAHLPQLQAQGELAVPDGLDVTRVLWLLTRETTPRQYTLRQRGRLLYVEAEAPTTTALEAPGSPLSRLSATSHSIQVQRPEADDAGAPFIWHALERGIVLPAEGPLLLRTEHQEVRLESLTRPALADSLGQDRQGLYMTWAEEQRKAYWVPPGSYPVTDRSGATLGHVSLTRGFWCDAAEAQELLQDGFRQPEWAAEYGRDEAGLYADVRIGNVTQRMRWIAPGEFCMGSPEHEPERFSDETLHPVILTRGFWLADTACTQALWQAVMGPNPSQFRGAERPVETVSWDDVQAFLQHLPVLAPELAWRLPTEAEWEYACRAGTSTPFWFGEQITPEQVNYDGRFPYTGGKGGLYRGETVPVQALPCNSWGLYQMHGNVWEWCQDWSAAYAAATAEAPAVDPVGPAAGAFRVLRGGCWFIGGGNARSARRGADGRPWRPQPRLRFSSCPRSSQAWSARGASQGRCREGQTDGAMQSRSGPVGSAPAEQKMKCRFLAIPAARRWQGQYRHRLLPDGFTSWEVMPRNVSGFPSLSAVPYRA